MMQKPWMGRLILKVNLGSVCCKNKFLDFIIYKLIAQGENRSNIHKSNSSFHAVHLDSDSNTKTETSLMYELHKAKKEVKKYGKY